MPISVSFFSRNSARICSSSLGPVMSVLLKGKGDATLVKRFSDQFLGTERSDVYWWLKSMEAVGKQNIYDAIACLKKMSHQNPRVLTAMARLNYRIDKRDEARRLLRTAHANDPLWIDGMDLLAFLCIGVRGFDLFRAVSPMNLRKISRISHNMRRSSRSWRPHSTQNGLIA